MVQHYFAALDEKRFLLSDIVQDLPIVTDMHVPTRPACLLSCGCLFLTCENLCKLSVCFVHSA